MHIQGRHPGVATGGKKGYINLIQKSTPHSLSLHTYIMARFLQFCSLHHCAKPLLSFFGFFLFVAITYINSIQFLPPLRVFIISKINQFSYVTSPPPVSIKYAPKAFYNHCPSPITLSYTARHTFCLSAAWEL